MQRCIDAVSNALSRSNHRVSNGRSSPLPFAHVQLHAREFEGHRHQFSLVAEKFGKGHVHRKNLADVWKRELKACDVRRRNNVATMSQRCRIDVAHRFPRARPLQGKRPVSAPLQTRTDAEQRTEALQDCLNAVSNAIERKSCFTIVRAFLTALSSRQLLAGQFAGSRKPLDNCVKQVGHGQVLAQSLCRAYTSYLEKNPSRNCWRSKAA